MPVIQSLNIGGSTYSLTAKPFYGTCADAASVANKTVTCSDFKAADLVAGAMILVKSVRVNTASVSSLTLNVNSTGAKPIKKIYNGAISNLNTTEEFGACTILFIYDGTNWVASNLNYNTDTTYAVTNSSPTLAWGTTSAIGAVGSTTLYVTMPSNPNTDTYPTALSWTDGTTAGPKPSISRSGTTTTAVTGDAIPSASATASGVVTTGAQEFAGRKKIDLYSPSVYDGTGNTSRYKYIYFKNNAGTTVGTIRYDSGNATNVSSGRMVFYEASPNSTASTTSTGFFETYALPTVTTGLTADAGYQILTSKAPVTIAQGGTGATTAALARTALGLGTAATVAISTFAAASHTHDYSKVSFTQTNTSGDEIGKITIDGTAITLYADSDTDTKVTQTVSTTNSLYPILAKGTTATSTVTDTSTFDAKLAVNHSTGRVVTNGTVSSTRTAAVGFDVQSGGNQLATLWGYSVGTTSTVGWGGLALGNSTASGTAGNARGFIYLYGTGTGLNQLDSGNTGTTTYTQHLPMVTGNVAVGSTSGAGGTTKGVYLKNTGELVACSYSLGMDVPSGSKLTDTNYYPTTWTWTAGGANGPTAKITGSGMSDVSVAAIPSASASASGIVTTGAQTFAGAKTFATTVYFANGTTYYVGSTGNAKFNTLTAAGAATFSSTASFAVTTTFNGRIVGKAGAVTAGNYTTSVPTAAGVAGQIMFVLQ